MESAFVAGRDDDIDAGLLAALRALDGRHNVHPGKAGALDLVFQPTDRPQRKNDLKLFFHVRIILHEPGWPCRQMILACLNQFRRDHDIDAENSALVLVRRYVRLSSFP
jgi:hypothetical protein